MGWAIRRGVNDRHEAEGRWQTARLPAIFLGGKHVPLAGFSEIHEPDTVFATYPIVPFTPTLWARIVL
jgi:hypothetical protein